MDARNTTKHNSSTALFIVIQCFILACIVLFRLNYDSFDAESELLIYPFSCLLVFISLWAFYSWYFLTKSLFNPYLLFYLSAFLFNGGQALLEIFHLNTDGMLGGLEFSNDFSSLNLINTLFLVILGLASFHLGALISLIAFSRSQSSHITSEAFILPDRSNNCYKVGLYLFWLSLLPTVSVLLSSIRSVLSAGYGSLYGQEDGTGLNATPMILATFLMPASFFILVGSKDKPKGQWIAGTIIFFYALTRFFLGQRNQAAMPLITFAWLWNYYIAPLPKIMLLSFGALMMFVIFPLVSVTRSIAGADRLSLDFLLTSFTSIDNPIIASISEMGASMITVAYSLQLVPNFREFQFGLDYLFALFTLIPNIFGDLHPTIARGLIEKWLTEQANPYFAAAGGSYGLSFIAEAYVNFGWIGTPITLAIIGFLFAKLTRWATTSKEPAKIAMVASFLSFFLFYARAESAIILRPLVWYALFPYLWVCFLSPLKPRSFKS